MSLIRFYIMYDIWYIYYIMFDTVVNSKITYCSSSLSGI